MAEPGRPETTDEQFLKWLDLMTPWLKAGNTIYYALEKADLINHQTTIYEKYRLNDWFSQKVNRLRALPGELANEAFYKLVQIISDKVKTEVPLSREDIDILKFFAEKHRTSQPFFVTRTETAVADPSQVGKILDTIEEANKTDYGKLADNASAELNKPAGEQPKPADKPA